MSSKLCALRLYFFPHWLFNHLCHQRRQHISWSVSFIITQLDLWSSTLNCHHYVWQNLHRTGNTFSVAKNFVQVFCPQDISQSCLSQQLLRDIFISFFCICILHILHIFIYLYICILYICIFFISAKNILTLLSDGRFQHLLHSR